MNDEATHSWAMFAGHEQQPYMRLHYLYKDKATSAGYVEQRNIRSASSSLIADRREFYATCNEKRAALNKTKVASLEEGMMLIEWLVREKERSK